jgi:hypothetical protein
MCFFRPDTYIVSRSFCASLLRPDVSAVRPDAYRQLVVAGYSDADWAGNADDRKSTSGGCFYVGNNLVAWMSKKQASISLSPLLSLSILLRVAAVPNYCG